ncbi:MAG: GNAT family N-acetyltransferase [Streptosporangiaceae bacterium]
MNRTQPSGPGWPRGRAAVAIRQVRPERDLPALSDFFAGLSTHSRYLRFFGPVTPGVALLRTLAGCAGNVDALVAVRGGVIVGHAMAVDRAEPRGTRVTDIGVVVDDAWQGRGVGAALMRSIVTGAQARGVTVLEMDVLDGNRQVLAMVTGHWPAARVEHTPDGLAIRVRLPQASVIPAAITPHLALG